MDIGSRNNYPSSSLSNFAGHRFEIDGVLCYSMEGFLQSLKFESKDIQESVYWRGVEIKRNSQEYQDLLDRAYQCMYDQSESFRNALKASMNSTLTHSMGKKNKNETILTVSEFCSRLTNLRDYGKLSF